MKEVRSNLRSDMKFLKHIGFTSSFEKVSILHPDFTIETNHAPGISLSDFWSKAETDKFLKETGTLIAYNQLLKNHKMKRNQSVNSILNPDKPYKMDLNLKRNKIFSENKQYVNDYVKRSLHTKIEPPKCKGDNKQIDLINKACYSLYKQNGRLRNTNKVFKRHFRESVKDLKEFLDNKDKEGLFKLRI